MTALRARPYSADIRHALASLCLALCGCATDSVSRHEFNELSLSLRAMRSENDRLAGKIDRIEQTLASNQVVSTMSFQKNPSVSTDALPPLIVVKLKPRSDPPPRVKTEVAVIEPSQAWASATVEPSSDRDDDTDIADLAFHSGLDALKTGDIEGGVRQMRQFVEQWPRHPKADNALAYAGVGQMNLGAYDEALKSFEAVSKHYPAGDASAEALLHMGECQLKLRRAEQAKAAWERLIESDPQTAAATQARLHLSSLAARATTTEK